jgi:hypothetical protein
LFEFTMLFQKHSRPFASSHQIPKTSKTLAKTFGNFQKRKCSPVEKTFRWDCWKTSCRWSWKTTSNFTSKRLHQKLIPNSFAVQIASSANEFHRKRSSSPCMLVFRTFFWYHQTSKYGKCMYVSKFSLFSTRNHVNQDKPSHFPKCLSWVSRSRFFSSIGKGERESGLDPTYVWTAKPSKLTNAKLGKVQCSRTLSFSSRDFEGPRLCSSGPIQLSDQLTHHKTA